MPMKFILSLTNGKQGANQIQWPLQTLIINIYNKTLATNFNYMKFEDAWGVLSLEQKQAIAKRVALNYLVIFLIPLLPFIFLIIFFSK